MASRDSAPGKRHRSRAREAGTAEGLSLDQSITAKLCEMLGATSLDGEPLPDGKTVATLVAETRNLGDRVEITIRDNGTGIPPDVKEKMFNPFFTTKPAGEGTGLGLSISHDIIVKQHGGSIEVKTQTGEFTEIRIILPRAGVSQPTAP